MQCFATQPLHLCISTPGHGSMLHYHCRKRKSFTLLSPVALYISIKLQIVHTLAYTLAGLFSFSFSFILFESLSSLHNIPNHCGWSELRWAVTVPLKCRDCCAPRKLFSFQAKVAQRPAAGYSPDNERWKWILAAYLHAAEVDVR